METSTPRRRADSLLSPSYSPSISEFCPLDELRAQDEDECSELSLLGPGPIQCATDLLVLLSPNDRVFESVSPFNSSEQSSCISIPFSDAIVDECVRKEAARDRRLVNEEIMAFSTEFKKAMAESRHPGKESLDPDDLSSVATMMTENPEDILQMGQQLAAARRRQQQHVPSVLLSGILASIARSIDEFRSTTPEEEESDSYDEEGDDEDESAAEKRVKSRKTSKPSVPVMKKAVDEDVEYYDTSSGLWRMLSAYDDLVLTQPGYRREERHCMVTDPVPWGVMEESRNKCLEWLEKHHGQAGF